MTFAIPMNKKFAAIVLAAGIVGAMFAPAVSFAQSTAPTADATSLTITPPFFELNVSPGDSWSSSIRVVNTNPSDLQVHAVVMGFAASDDQGHGNFVPLADLAGNEDALANWVTVSSPSVTVPRGGSADVPFSISVPQDAAPGGHYGAILIGTGSPVPQAGISQVGVSSFISALIFVDVAGNVNESAQIREFSTGRFTYETPDVHFAVRVQNDGNVHVRPFGMIQIYNVFGKLRGEVPINATGNLGYVLPSSTREFDVEWQGTPSLLDSGPYTAVVSLAYGENGVNSVSATTEFWIVPIGQILEVLFGVLLLAAIFIFIVRRSVRKMLASEISKYGGAPPVRPASSPAPEKKIAPTQSSGRDILDLRNPDDQK